MNKRTVDIAIKTLLTLQALSRRNGVTVSELHEILGFSERTTKSAAKKYIDLIGCKEVGCPVVEIGYRRKGGMPGLQSVVYGLMK